MRSLLFLAAFVPLAFAQVTCTTGWTAVTGSFGNVVCLRNLGTDNRENAYNRCKKIGGSLAQAQYAGDNAAIATFAGGDYWLKMTCIRASDIASYYGGNNDTTCTMWTETYAQSANGQGNPDAGTCLYGDSTGTWHNSDCFSQQAQVICTNTLWLEGAVVGGYSKCLTGYYEQAMWRSETWNGTKSACYKYHDTAVDQATAEETCQKEGGHLVSVIFPQENEFIRDLVTYKTGPFGTSTYTRIGLNKDNEDNEYIWPSWAPVNYMNFLNPTYENGGSSYDCIAMDSNGKWIPAPCTGTTGIGGFICKRAASSLDDSN